MENKFIVKEKQNHNFIIYYQMNNGQFRVYDNLFSRQPEKSIKSFDRLDVKRFRYFLIKGYDASDEGLREFAKDFKTMVYELRVRSGFTLNYTESFTHHHAVISVYVYKSKIKGKKKVECEKLKSYYSDFDKIIYEEDKWFEKCYNGALIFCDEGVYEGYGYDFSSFFPYVMVSDDFMVPSKIGENKMLKKLPRIDKLLFGLYRVKIECHEKDFKKIFSFSKENVYTNYSLKWALKHQERFNVKIELIQDDEPNAYLYKTEDLVSGKYLFGDWYKFLMKLKKDFPKNALLKYLLSSLWGHLTQRNTENKTFKQINDEKLDVGIDDTCKWKILNQFRSETSEYYLLLNQKEPYKFPFRIKSFLTSLCRNVIADVVLRDIDNVIRVHTDNCVFKIKKTFEDLPNLLQEEKTTGKIEWFNANSYIKYKQIDGFVNYEINDLGQIKNITNGKILKQKVSEEGKKEVVLLNGKKRETIIVSDLMRYYFKKNNKNAEYF